MFNKMRFFNVKTSILFYTYTGHEDDKNARPGCFLLTGKRNRTTIHLIACSMSIDYSPGTKCYSYAAGYGKIQRRPSVTPANPFVSPLKLNRFSFCVC